NEKCIGCRFCMAACPYSTRIFNWDDVKVDPVAEKDHHCGTHVRGTVEKCDFCPQMTRKGELPDCVTACPNGVFYFGDENEDTVTNGDETVRLGKLLKDKSAYRFMEDLGTKPRVYYLPPTNRLFEFKDKEDVKES
ncbi:MAG: 4Fe-4S dicluster domain-containing protein, partial [Bacteroidia bacterium]